MQLDTIHQVCEQRRAQHLAHIGMVVTQAGEPLAGVEVKITAAAGVVQIRTSRRSILLVESEDPQHIDERSVEVARSQVQRLLRTLRGFRHQAERIDVNGLSGDGHDNRRTYARRETICALIRMRRLHDVALGRGPAGAP